MFKYNFYMALMAIASLFIGQNLVYFYLDSKLAPDIALKKYVVLLLNFHYDKECKVKVYCSKLYALL